MPAVSGPRTRPPPAFSILPSASPTVDPSSHPLVPGPLPQVPSFRVRAVSYSPHLKSQMEAVQLVGPPPVLAARDQAAGPTRRNIPTLLGSPHGTRWPLLPLPLPEASQIFHGPAVRTACPHQQAPSFLNPPSAGSRPCPHHSHRQTWVLSPLPAPHRVSERGEAPGPSPVLLGQVHVTGAQGPSPALPDLFSGSSPRRHYYKVTRSPRTRKGPL